MIKYKEARRCVSDARSLYFFGPHPINERIPGDRRQRPTLFLIEDLRLITFLWRRTCLASRVVLTDCLVNYLRKSQR